MPSKPALLINRELGWLEFNQRVLNEACDVSVPLLERLNFLSITASNLDEFFMVRVGGLEVVSEDRGGTADESGMTPAQQLVAIRKRTRDMIEAQYSIYTKTLVPELEKAGIRMIAGDALTDEQNRWLEVFFNDEIFPVVTPMSLDGSGELPMLANLKMYALVRLKPAEAEQKQNYAIIPLGPGLKRFVTVPAGSGYAYLLVENVIHRFLDRFFPGKVIAESVTFRITRSADFSIDEDSMQDFLAGMRDVITRRKEARCVRLDFDRPASKTLQGFLVRMLKVPEDMVYEIPGPLNLADMRELSGLGGFGDLRYEKWDPQSNTDIDSKKSMFENIAGRDILLTHPYESFDPVVRLIEEAAADPDVMAIKQTLYRTSSNSPIVNALKRAAEKGKYVTALVELKARFDEERNIEWAHQLERSGVQVIYGVKGLKTHAKICIIVRREPGGIARYMHFGTGNYNERTARLYTDVGLLTRNADLGADASAFFNAITGYSEPQKFLKLFAAPIGLRERLAELIASETERSRQGQKAAITAKMNSLVDAQLIKALYEASGAGVKIRLNVRGICCLRPGVEGMSSNITVVSIVDRFLEHSRIFHFYAGGADTVYISSADWMPRNLDRRVELMTPVEDEACKARLLAILNACFKDTAKAGALRSDGSYERLAAPGRRKEFSCQEFLFKESCRRKEEAGRAPVTFEPHKPIDADDARHS